MNRNPGAKREIVGSADHDGKSVVMATVVSFGPVEEKVRGQLDRCAEQAVVAVLCADNHYGYSQPVGAAVAYRDYISLSGVGYDIACGNKAVKTDIDASTLGRRPWLRSWTRS